MQNPRPLVIPWPPPRRPPITRVPLDRLPPELWASCAHTVLHEGLWITTVGVDGLARALHRSSHMIRRMETDGVLPAAPIRDDIRGNSGCVEHEGRRAYTLDMVRDAARIAAELGVLDRQPRRWADTDFPARVRGAWEARIEEIRQFAAVHKGTVFLPLRPDR